MTPARVRNQRRRRRLLGFLSDNERASGRGHGFVAAAVNDRYRLVVGTIGYASSEFLQDLAWKTSSLSRQFVTPNILDAKRANAALQYAQKNRVILKYRRGVENRTMFHDGPLGNLDDERVVLPPGPM
jgi:hypothetical protein